MFPTEKHRERLLTFTGKKYSTQLSRSETVSVIIPDLSEASAQINSHHSRRAYAGYTQRGRRQHLDLNRRGWDRRRWVTEQAEKRMWVYPVEGGGMTSGKSDSEGLRETRLNIERCVKK